MPGRTATSGRSNELCGAVMNYHFVISLFDPEGNEYAVGCKFLLATSGLVEDEFTPVQTGRIRIIIDKGLPITVDWRVVYQDTTYQIVGITPYIKSPIPQRIVLTCEPTDDEVG